MFYVVLVFLITLVVIKSQVFWDGNCVPGRIFPDGSKELTAFKFKLEQAKKRDTYREVGGVR